jgi:hypothetical protein
MLGRAGTECLFELWWNPHRHFFDHDCNLRTPLT